MFTGLVSSSGQVAARIGRGPGARLTVHATFSDGPIGLGESIAVDGCCLTVAAVAPKGFEADMSAETLLRTTLGTVHSGHHVNLERALRVTDRLGGHLVAGHVDGVSTLIGRRPVGDSAVMTFTVPEGLGRYIAEKGSIALSGVSLTVNGVDHSRFDVTTIPITLAATNLGRLTPGDRVNVEVDIIARYVGKLMEISPSGGDKVG
ncbi:MAG: riboflavin synthase [Polyangiaceae bacterium]|jgi:riboflavin synthase